MQKLSGQLAELVAKLDASSAGLSLVDLAHTMEQSRLTLDDVREFVQSNPQHYNRALVVLREKYELLVMTWLPGQSSVPHDHAGSICIMQVVQGDAAEASYRVTDDGYVEQEYETTIRCGEISAGQDAGVHTVRNPSESAESLVTIHIYVPPLREFRRFVPRPASVSPSASEPSRQLPTIVVVGGGFSGAMTAAQILRRASLAKSAVRVALVERRGAIGEGLAYGTRDASHLLNVPAGRMSAWPDRPDDFVTWAKDRLGDALPGDFLPRQLYGEYVRERLLSIARESQGTATLDVLLDEVRRISRHPAGGWMVHMARGASVRADCVILAIGHRAPTDPIGVKWSGPRTRFIADPWRPFAMSAVRPDDAVICLGSGLTAVDAVLSLAHPTRQAPVTLLSRNGLVPQSHADAPLPPADLQPMVSELCSRPNGIRAVEILRKLRQSARDLAGSGVNWRSIIDGLRPHTVSVWQAMSVQERRRFLRRLRPFWEVHRHRMAPGVAAQFQTMRERGLVRVVAARVIMAQASDDGVRLIVSERGSGRLVEHSVAWVVNCTGPAPSNSAVSNPAIGSLLVHGLLQRDELEMGVETTQEGNAIGANGQSIADLLIVGTLRKPGLWESTAVPELRGQAATAAQQALACVLQPVRPPHQPHFLEPREIPKSP